MEFDPEKHIHSFLECLTQDKKPIGLLIGAGCPCAIKDSKGNKLIPDIQELTTKINEKMIDNITLNAIISTLAKEGNVKPTIEDYLTRTRGLKEYIGEEKILKLKSDDFDKLDKDLCQKIKEIVDIKKLDKDSPYHQLANWIGSINRTTPVEIFTTNYDLLMEMALEDLQLPHFDGFVGSYHPFFDSNAIEFDKLPANWIRLWKIHGSINWRIDKNIKNLRVWRSDDSSSGELVIHPTHLKYEQSRKMPYLAMMDRFRQFLNSPSGVLITIGFSFRDQHLNEVILQGLRRNPTLIVFALMHGTLDNSIDVVKLANEKGNLSVFAQDGAVIGTKKANWQSKAESPDSDLLKDALVWIKNQDNWIAKVILGDFKQLGISLNEISGQNNE